MHDQQSEGNNGTLHSWALSLWGEARDAALARPYKLPFDETLVLPPDPSIPQVASSSAAASLDVSPTSIGPPAMASHHTVPTKTYARPTAHLPDDHGEAPGELHPSTTTTPGEPWPTAVVIDDEAIALGGSDAEPSSGPISPFGGRVSALVKSSAWLFIGGSMAVAVSLGLGLSFVILRRRRRLALERGPNTRGYFFEALSGQDDADRVAMRNMPRTGEASAGRTRALYDAFALDDSDESDDGAEAGERLGGATYTDEGEGEGTSAPERPRSPAGDEAATLLGR